MQIEMLICIVLKKDFLSHLPLPSPGVPAAHCPHPTIPYLIMSHFHMGGLRFLLRRCLLFGVSLPAKQGLYPEFSLGLSQKDACEVGT